MFLKKVCTATVAWFFFSSQKTHFFSNEMERVTVSSSISIEFVKIIYIVVFAHLEIASLIFLLLKNPNNLKYFNQKSHMLYFFWNKVNWKCYFKRLLDRNSSIYKTFIMIREIGVFVLSKNERYGHFCLLLTVARCVNSVPNYCYFLGLFRKNGQNCCCINKYYELYAD